MELQYLSYGARIVIKVCLEQIHLQTMTFCFVLVNGHWPLNLAMRLNYASTGTSLHLNQALLSPWKDVVCKKISLIPSL